MLTAPFTPMLFMGEEWGASTPWQFFTDHTDPELAEAVAEGRTAEFAAHGWDPADVPDPQDQATFLRSKLDWAEPDEPRTPSMLAWYTGADRAAPGPPGADRPAAGPDAGRLRRGARWLVLHRGRLRIAANLGEAAPRRCRSARPGTAVLAATSPGVSLEGERLRMPPASFAVVAT